jgi:hypothetical protein
MTATTRSVRELLASLEAWEDADVARMPADDALTAVEAGARVLHALQGVVARFAARVDVVCEQSPGMSGYARRHGYASGPALLAAVTGFGPGEANRLATLGRALLEADAGAERARREAAEVAAREPALEPALAPEREREPMPEPERGTEGALDWDEPEPERLRAVPTPPAPPRELAPGEYLARAVDTGRLGADKAEVIRATLSDFTVDSREAEREFVDLAQRVGLRKLKAHCFWRLGELDPAGLARREARQRGERFVSVTDGPDGMVTIFGKLDVATAAPIKALLDGMTSAAMRRQRKLRREERLTAGELCADALADVAQHALGCEELPTRPKTTVVVRIDKDALVDDLRDIGVVGDNDEPLTAQVRLASCDGILQPITASAARLMAVDAQILPAVMGGRSLPLDLGGARRLFTTWQKTAVNERDRGCVRCTAPPAFCHGHHIRFWDDDGPTNIANAVSLCSGCHHRLHEQRWELIVHADHVEVRERDTRREPGRQPGSSDRHPLDLLPVDAVA